MILSIPPLLICQCGYANIVLHGVTGINTTPVPSAVFKREGIGDKQRKLSKDSTNCVLEMDHGETFPAIYLGQDVDVCFCEENNVTEVVVSHCEGGKLRMAMDEFQSQVNKREMLISCYVLSDFISSALMNIMNCLPI